MVKLDPNNAFHARVAERLKTEAVGWFVTTGPDGTPQPSPVWFLWDGADSLLIYSQHTPKLANITNQPRVAFHFNSDEHGGNVVTFTGTARLDSQHPKAADFQPYLDKYAAGIADIGYTVEQFSGGFSEPVIVTLEKVRGH
jgi:PPOX class probable F420-dependent enzyme